MCDHHTCACTRPVSSTTLPHSTAVAHPEVPPSMSCTYNHYGLPYRSAAIVLQQPTHQPQFTHHAQVSLMGTEVTSQITKEEATLTTARTFLEALLGAGLTGDAGARCDAALRVRHPFSSSMLHFGLSQSNAMRLGSAAVCCSSGACPAAKSVPVCCLYASLCGFSCAPVCA